MLHPIYQTLLGHPELVGDHIANYGALIKQEAKQTGRSLLGRLLAGVVAVVSAMLALGLIGIAVMLGALHGFHWVLAAVPALAGGIAMVAGSVASRPAQLHVFGDLQAQIDADLSALHLATPKRHER